MAPLDEGALERRRIDRFGGDDADTPLATERNMADGPGRTTLRAPEADGQMSGYSRVRFGPLATAVPRG
jgi:hypothetical protein